MCLGLGAALPLAGFALVAEPDPIWVKARALLDPPDSALLHLRHDEHYGFRTDIKEIHEFDIVILHGFLYGKWTNGLGQHVHQG